MAKVIHKSTKKPRARQGRKVASSRQVPEVVLLSEDKQSYAMSTGPKESKLRVVPPDAPVPLGIASVLTLKGQLPEYRISPFEKMEMIEEGISKKALQNLKEKAALDYDQLSQVLNVARATLINKKGNEKFGKDVSDKILGLADLYSYGYEVFEERGRFNQWIFRANRALGGQAPFDILHTSFGRAEVKNLIGRIDYGVYS